MKGVRRPRYCRQSGVTGSVLTAMLLLTCIAVGGLASDFGHGVLVRAQLQNACDAAAMAGLQDMIGSSGPPTSAQYTQVRADAIAVGSSNLADQKPVNDLVFTNPVVIYNSNPSVTAPIYSVQVVATAAINNTFAVIFGNNTTTIKAMSRAGVFSQSSVQYGTLGQVSFPMAVAIQVNTQQSADGQSGANSALQYFSPGSAWKIEADGATDFGAQNSSWVELRQGQGQSPLSPLSTGDTLGTQWAAQLKPGIVTQSDGSSWAYLSGPGDNSSTSGQTGWTQYIVNQIAANAGGFLPPAVQVTMPVVDDPIGNTQPNSLNKNTALQVIGLLTVNISQTSQGPGTKLEGSPSFKGTVVNAMPLNSAAASNWGFFFNRFAGGTPVMRLY